MRALCSFPTRGALNDISGSDLAHPVSYQEAFYQQTQSGGHKKTAAINLLRKLRFFPQKLLIVVDKILNGLNRLAGQRYC